MSVDLFAILTGSATGAVEPLSAGNGKARLDLEVRCRCGRLVAAVRAAAAGHVVDLGPWRLTKAHTARIVLDAAIADLEAELEAGQEDVASRIVTFLEAADETELTERLPALVIPGVRNVRLSTLAEAVHRERGRASARGVVPDQITNFTTSCGNCRTVYYLGSQIVDWFDERSRPRRIVAQDEQESGYRRRIMTGTWPRTARSRRVALYAHLSNVLASIAQ
ncbi:MAG: hypothetical protein ACTMIR_08865 [Cellulomonadaceae bacterium]